ncbi:MAG TPA: DUF4190 domain-containing protein [Verrucomicrobiae bacterium]|jgi:hypothetical protein
MYKIIGQDGKEYGPITAGQLRQWISQNRVESRTPVFKDGAKEWTFAGLLPEFAALFSIRTPQVPPTIAPPNQPRTNNSFAIAGLIFGIVSFLCCCKFLFAPLGIVFSLIGLSQINRHPELYEGRSLAIAGLVLSIVSLLLAVVLVIFALATGNFHFNWNVNGFGN